MSSGGIPVVVYDPTHKLQGILRHTIKGILAQMKQKAVVRYDRPELTPILLSILSDMGNCVFIADEAQEVFPRHKCDPRTLSAIHKGRNTGLGICWSTQRTPQVHTDLTGNSQAIIAGRFLAKPDKNYCRDWGIIQPLPLYCFQMISPKYENIIHFQSTKFE